MRAKTPLILFFTLAAAGWLSVVPAFAQASSYPQIDISGYKKWEYKKPSVDPQRNYFSGLTQLGGYYQTLTGSPLQERLQLKIIGELSKDLSVGYDLEQQPEIPDRFDVKVKYFNSELTFGDISANFTGNEFASTSKFVNGVMLTAKGSWYDVIAVPSSKLKSQTQNLTTQQGNNTKGPYNLGHGSIVEGSEKLQLNNVPLARNVDYTIDYFEGKVTFNRILTQLDELKYSYEYTNVLDLFFPSLSKRDFLGLQTRFTFDPEEFDRMAVKPEPVMADAKESFPSPASNEAEEESTGEYQLANFPVVEFSEKITFMGTQLKRNEDYMLWYNTGDLKLYTRFLPTTAEPMVIEYKYYIASSETAPIPGIGSRGPYLCPHANLVVGSERVELDGRLLAKDLDYTLDYKNGQIMFNFVVGPTSLINATYRYKTLELPAQVVSKFPKELKVGATYLRESAKKTSGTATAAIVESFVGTKNGHIYLQNRPIAPTTESGSSFVVKVDGRTLTREVDYFIPTTSIDPATGRVIVTPEATLAYINDKTDPSDGYQTGTIKFAPSLTIASTSQVTVTFTYYKSVVGKYSGSGGGNRGPYYLRNIRNVIPGTETVQVWDQGSSVITTFTRNSSPDAADAGATGYSINYNADLPSITFNNDLPSTKNFQVIFQYVPPRVFENGDIAQSVVGFDGSFKIGDIFKVDSAYAKSETDQVYVAETTIESLVINGTKNYTLHAPQNLIEGSEQITVNNYTLNRDIDYYVSYTAPGQITFYYITPSTQDAISVTYQYQSTSGSVVGQGLKTGAAYRLGAETKLFGDTLVVNGNTKNIDFNFSPLGGTSIGIGSSYKEYNVKFDPKANSLLLNYSYKENLNPTGNTRDRFIRTYDNIVDFGVNPRDLVKINVNYRSYNSLDDLNRIVATHSNDSKQDSYGLGVVPADWQRGVLAFTQAYDYKKSVSQTDTERDSNSYSNTTITFAHGNWNLKFTDRFSAGFDAQVSEPTVITLTSSTTEATHEATSSHTRALDTASNLTLDLTFGRIDKWTARVSLLDHKDLTFTRNFIATDETQATKNETYHMDFIPVSVLVTSLDHNRQERTTFVVGGANPKSERTAANVRFSPNNWLSAGWDGSQSESIPETGAVNRTTGRANTYNASVVPFSLERVKLSANFTLSNNLQTAPSGSLEGVRTDTDNFVQNYAMNIIPHPNLPINLGLTLENYKNYNNNPMPSSKVDTETANQTLTAGLAFTPFTALNLSMNYNKKITRVLKDMVIPPSDRTKTVLASKAIISPWTWGNFAYDREDEDNGGEVQGGSMANLNYQKTTQTYSVNISVPVDNAVVSSFILTASSKIVGYKNRSNSADDFTASLMSFEGSLNF